jgi:restriction system protein
MKRKEVPQFDELMAPTLEALKKLGGSASIDELVPEMVRCMGLPQEIADIPHGNTSRTELEYRVAWARTYLRKAGLIENSERGIWALMGFPRFFVFQGHGFKPPFSAHAAS